MFNPLTPTAHFSFFQNNEWKCPLQLLSVEKFGGFCSLAVSAHNDTEHVVNDYPYYSLKN